MINEFKKQSLNTWLRQLEGGPDLEGVFKGERRGGGREKGWGEGEGPAARTDQAINIMILQVPRPPFFYKLYMYTSVHKPSDPSPCSVRRQRSKATKQISVCEYQCVCSVSHSPVHSPFQVHICRYVYVQIQVPSYWPTDSSVRTLCRGRDAEAYAYRTCTCIYFITFFIYLFTYLPIHLSTYLLNVCVHHKQAYRATREGNLKKKNEIKEEEKKGKKKGRRQRQKIGYKYMYM